MLFQEPPRTTRRPGAGQAPGTGCPRGANHPSRKIARRSRHVSACAACATQARTRCSTSPRVTRRLRAVRRRCGAARGVATWRRFSRVGVCRCTRRRRTWRRRRRQQRSSGSSCGRGRASSAAGGERAGYGARSTSVTKWSKRSRYTLAKSWLVRLPIGSPRTGRHPSFRPPTRQVAGREKRAAVPREPEFLFRCPL